MSVAEIQQAVVSIKTLSPEERVRMYHWAMAEMEQEATYAEFDQACAAGYYEAIIRVAQEEHRRGESLTSLD